MLSIILGVVGLAGGGSLAALVAKFGAKAVLGGAGRLFKGVPRWAWIALLVVVALVALTIWHQHRAHAAIAAAKAEQKAADDAPGSAPSPRNGRRRRSGSAPPALAWRPFPTNKGS
jgi:type VI protein secretion system component VasK